MKTTNKQSLAKFKTLLSQLAVFLMTSLSTYKLFANPVLGHISSGNITIQQTSNSTVVNQASHQAIINWQSFNIGANQSTHFIQPAGGMILNRISASDGPSSIYGQLTATGQIILINPAGIFFAPGSYVNVGSMIATTANITNQNFLKGNYQFTNVPGYNGSIINQGTIIAATNGLIALVGNAVDNSGMIQANLGQIVLASGNAFTMNFAGNDLINFNVTQPTKTTGVDQNGNPLKNGVANTGTLIADGGQILVTAQAAAGVVDNVIDMQGVAQAQSVGQQNGDIILSGDTTGGEVYVAAKLDASGKSANQTGGNVAITGYNILIDSPTLIDVSGDAGGGNINIGGSAHGAGPLPNANATVIAPNANLLADAITNGNGGKIVVWSNEMTKVYGSISAQGGVQSGNAGWVETSSHNYLDVNGAQVNLRAANGSTGTWLLDPSDIYIADNQADATAAGMTTTDTTANTESGNTFAATDATKDSLLLNTTLDMALSSANITVTTTNASGTGTGNIFVVSPISWSSGNTLTLTAANNISINNAITTGTSASALILDPAIVNAYGTVTQNSLGIIGGSGRLIQEGTGADGASEATLSQANTYSGGTTLSGGNLTITNVNALGTGPISVASGAQLELNFGSGTLANTQALTLIGSGPDGFGALYDQASTGTQTLSNPITLGGSSSIGGAYINATLALTGGINTGTTAADYILTFSETGDVSQSINAITGTGGVTVSKYNPAATVSLNTTNSYTGGTIIDKGTLSVSTSYALGSAASDTLTFNGGTLQTTTVLENLPNNYSVTAGDTGSVVSTVGAVNLSGAGILNNGSTLSAPNGTILISGGLSLPTNGTSMSPTSETLSGELNIETNPITGGVALYNTLNIRGNPNGPTFSVASTYNGITNINNLVNLSLNVGTNAGFTNGPLGVSSIILNGDIILESGGHVSIANPYTVASNTSWDGGNITFTGAGTLNSGTTLSFYPSVYGEGAYIFSGTISGAGAITVNGGSAILSGHNTYSGATTVSAGLLTLENTDAIDGTTLSLTGGSIDFDFPGTLANTQALTISGTGNGSGVLMLGGGSIVSNNVTLNGNASIGGSSGSGTLSGVINDNNNGYSLTKIGTANITLSGINTYSGGTTVSNGTLNVTNANALGTSGTISVTSGAELSINLGGATLANNSALTLNGSGISSAGALYEAGSSGTDVVSNAITLGSATTIGANTGSTLSLTGGITNAGFLTTFAGAGNISQTTTAITGSGGVTMSGTGTLTLGLANTYTGNTSVTSGILSATNTNSLGSSSGGTISVSSGGELSMNLGGATLANNNALTLNGTGISSAGALYEAGSSGTDIVSNAITLGSATTIGANTGSTLSLTGGITNAGFRTTFAGAGNISQATTAITGLGGVTMSGTGTLTLGGANTYTGSTTISSGILSATNTNALGSASGGTISVTSGAELSINLGGATLANNKALTLNGSGVGGVGALYEAGSSGTDIVSNAITLGSATTIEANTGSTLSLTGGITNAGFLTTFAGAGNISQTTTAITGSGGVTMSGTGTLTLGGANTYTGSTTISSGILSATNASGLGSTLSGSTISVASGAELSLNLGGATLANTDALTLNATGVGSVGALYEAGSSGTDILSNAITLGSATTIGANTGATLSLTGGITNAGFLTTFAGAGNISQTTTAITGTGGITMNGTGTLSLFNTNSFSGVSTLNSGTVLIGADTGLGAAPGTFAASQLTFGGGTLEANATFSLSANRGISLGTGGGTIDVTTGKTLTYGGTISGANALTVSNGSTGVLNLTTANTYTGGTILGSGVLELGNNNALGSLASDTLTFTGGTLEVSAVMTLPNNYTIAAGDTGTLGGYTYMILSGAGTLNNGSTLINAGANNYITGGLSLPTTGTSGSPTSETINVTSTSLTFETNPITGGGPYNTLNFGATNSSYPIFYVASTYSGITSLNSGAIYLDVGTNTGFTNGPLGIGSITLNGVSDLSSFGSLVSIANPYSVTSNSTIGGNGLTLSGPGTLSSGTTLTFGNSTYGSTLSGAVSGAGGITVNASTSGLVLSGNNSYTGATTVTAGTLYVDNVDALGSGSNLSTLSSISTGAALSFDFVGTLANTQALTISGTGVSSNLGALSFIGGALGPVAIVSNNLTLSGNTSIGGNEVSSSGTLSGVISDSNPGYTLTKVGSEPIYLSGTNTYRGGTIVNAGTLVVTNANALGTSGTISVTSGATLDLNLGGATLANNKALTLNGSGFNNLGALYEGGSSGTDIVSNAITLGSATTIDANTGSTLSLTGGITNAGFLTTFAGAGNISQATVAITGTGGITMNGSGTLTFGAANTYSGATTINAGTLQVNSTGDFSATSAVTLANTSGATLNLAGYSQSIPSLAGGGASGGNVTLGSGTLTIANAINGSNMTYAGIMSGTGGGLTLDLTGTSSPTLTLTGANTYTGTTTIQAGTLAVGVNNAISASSAVSMSGGTLSIGNGFSDTIASLTTTGGAVTLGNASSALTTNSLSGSGSTITLNGGNFNASGTGTFTGTIGGTTGDSGTFTMGGSGSLTINGSGLIQGSGVNVTVNGSGGTLTLASANTYGGTTTLSNGTLAVGNSSAIDDSALALNGGTLEASTSGITLTNAYTLNGSVNLDGGNTFSLNGTGTLTSGTLTVINSAITTLGGAISGAGAITENTTGTLIVSGDNSYSGNTTLTAGTLEANNASNPFGTGTLKLNGGSLQSIVSGGTTLGNSSVMVGASGSTINGSQNMTVTNGVALTGALAISNSATSTINGALSGSGGLNQSAGTLDLAGANTSYAGTTSVTGGTLNANSTSALGTGIATINGGSLNISNLALSSLTTLNLNGTGVGSNGALTGTGTAALASGIGVDLQTNSYIGIVNSADTLTINGSISGAGLTKVGSGTLVIAGSNSYTGATTINAGTLTLNASNLLANTTTLVLANTSGAEFNLNGYTQTVSGLSGGGGSGGNINLGAGTLTINEAGTQTYSGIISGTGGFALGSSSTGTLTLNNANVYGGTTVVNGGTLALSNNGAISSGNASVLTNGTLQLNNGITITNAITLNSGTLTGTGSSGEIASGNITLNGAGALATLASSDTFTIGGTINGAHTLTTTGPGSITFAGTIGNSIPVTSLTTSSAGTAKTIVNTAAITSANNQNYNDPITLNTGSTWISNTAGVIFSSAATINGANALNVQSATGIHINGTIGGTTPLSSLALGDGNIDVLSSNISTTGAQTYDNQVQIGANITLSSSASTIIFNNTLDSTSGTPNTLALSAAQGTTFNDPVGSTYPLGGLSLSGGATDTIATSAITTSGAQTFNDAVSITNAGATTLTATGGSSNNISFGNSLTWTGSNTLALLAGNVIVFDGAVANSSGSLQLAAANSSQSITTNSSGSINVDNFDVTQGQWYQNTASLPTFTVANNFQLGAGVSFIRAAGGGGTGTSGNPYEIIDIYGLQGVATTPADSFIMNTNINGTTTANWNSGAGFVPIGNSTTPYSGNFNGNAYLVTNLTINQPTATDIGLFGATSAAATITQIGVTSATIAGLNNVGALVGSNAGTLTLSYSLAGSVTGLASATNIGGLVGVNSGTVTNTYSQVPVTAGANSSDVAGLIGNNSGTLNTSYSTGLVTGGSGSTNVGGLLGANTGSLPSNSYWDEDTSNQLTSAGGNARSTANMQTQGNYVGWDFTNTWSIATNQYPVLQAFSAHPARVISGTTPDGAGDVVTLVANGVILDTTTTAANGTFTFSEVSGTVPDAANLLVYLSSGANVGDVIAIAPIGGASLTGLSVGANDIKLDGSATTFSNTLLGTAKGSLSSADIIYGVSGAALTLGNPTNLISNLITTAATTYTIDGAISTVLGGTSSVNFSGAVNMNGGSVTTSGTQTYTGAVSLGANTTLTGSSINFGSTINGAKTLSITGNTTFAGAVSGLTSINIVGTTAIDTATITTSGTQTYDGAVSIGGSSPITLISNNNNILFDTTVAGAEALTVAAGSGDVTFTGAVGSGTPLNGLSVSGSAISLQSVSTSGAQSYTGSTTMGGNYVTAGGTFGVTGAALLTANTSVDTTNQGGTPAGANINFSSTIDNAQTLSLTAGTTGAISINGDMGSGTPLSSLAASGNSMSFANVSTVGGQTYTGTGTTPALTLNGNYFTDGGALDITNATTTLIGTTTIDTTKNSTPAGNNITLAGVSGGANNLSLNAGTGGTLSGSSFNGTGTLTITNAANASFSGAVSASNIALTSSAGTIAFDGNLSATNVTTTAQDNNISLLGASTSIANAVSFQNTGTIALGNGGTLNFAGGVTATGGPTSTILNGDVTTNGNAIALAATTLNGNSVLDSTNGGNIPAGATIGVGAVTANNDSLNINAGTGGTISGTSFNGTNTLTIVNSAGSTFSGAITAGTIALTNSTGNVIFNGVVNANNLTTAAQAYNLQLNNNTTITNAVNFLNTGTLNLGSSAANNLAFTGGVTATTPTAVSVAGTLSAAGTGVIDLNSPISVTDNSTIGGASTGEITLGAITIADNKSLNIGNGAATPISVNNIDGTSTPGTSSLTFNSTSTVTATGAIGSSIALAGLTVDAPIALNGGTITTSGNSGQTYSDAVTLGSVTTLSSGAHPITFASTINSFNSTPDTLILTSTGTITLDGAIGSSHALDNLTVGAATASTLDISAGSIITAGTQTYNGAITLGSITSLQSTGSDITASGSTLNNGGFMLTVNNAGANSTIGDLISGAGSLTKAGQGTLTLSNTANTYSGTTSINNGTLSAAQLLVTGGSSSLGNAASAITLGSTTAATLIDTGASDTLNRNITIGGSGGGTLEATAGTLSVNDNISTASGPITLYANGGNISQVSGAISGAGNVNINGGTSSVITFAGTNSYTGATMINGGDLSIQSAGALGNGTNDTSSVAVASGTELDISNISLTASPALVLNGSGVSGNGALYESASSGTGTFGGAITLDSASTIGANTGSILALTGGMTNSTYLPTFTGAGNMSETGNITGSDGLTMSGTGTLTLGGSNSYSGTTAVSSGTVNLTSSTGLGNSSATVASGATLSITGNGLNIANSITLAGNGVGGNGALLDPGNNTISGSVTLAGNSTIGANTGDTLTISGLISDGGIGYGVTIVGGGTVIFSDADTYSGVTTIDNGTLQAGASNSFSPNSAVTFANTAGATLNLNGFNQTIASLAGGGTSGGDVILGADTLTIANAIAGSNTSYAGVISGTGGLTLNLTGTSSPSQTLSDANTYTGATTIQAGTLIIGANNAINSSSAVNMSGGELSLGAGLTDGIASLTTSGGAVVLGNGSTLTTGSLSGNSATITLSGGQLITEDSGADTFSGTIGASNTDTGTFTMAGSGSETVSGLIQGSGVAVDVNSGALTLTAANTYGNGSDVANGGLLIAGNNSALGTSLATVNAGGAVQINNGINISNALSLTGTGIGNNGVLIGAGGTGGTASGAITLGGNTTIGATNNGDNLVLMGNTITGNAHILNLVGLGTINLGDTFSNINSLVANANTIISANLTTSAAQTYHNPVTLASTVDLSGVNIDLASSITGGGYGLTLTDTGTSTLGGVVAGLASLATNAVDINTISVTTSGAQTYGAVSLGANTTLTGNGIDLASTVTGGGNSLNLIDSGTSTLGGAISGVSTLQTTAATLDANVTTSGTQNYTGAITLGNNVAIATTNSAVSFDSTVNGGAVDSLSIAVGTGTVTFNGAVGSSSQELASLAVTGATNLDGGSVYTSGTQTYNAVKVGASTTLSGVGITLGTINDATTAGTDSLTVNAGNGVLSFGAIGNSSALNNFTASNSGTGNNITVANNILVANDASFTSAGTIAETGSATIVASELTTSSVGGTTLGNNNNIDTLNASNTSSGNISFTNSAPLTIALLSENGGNLSINNNGAITQTGAIAVSGTATINANANSINLANSNNNFAGGVALDNSGANDVTLNNTGSLLTIASSNLGSGTTTITNTGALTQTGVITTTGGTVNLNTNSIASNASILTVDNNIVTNGGNINLTADQNQPVNTDALFITGATLNTGTATPQGTLTIGGGLVTSGVSFVIGSGNVTLQGNGSDLTLSGTDSYPVAVAFSVPGNIYLSGALSSSVGSVSFLSPVILTANTSVTSSASNGVTFASGVSGPYQLTLSSTANNSNYTLDGLLSAANIDIAPALGTTGNTLIVATSGVQDWTLTGADAGSMTGNASISFNTVQNINGGNGQNNFNLNTGSLSGSINGGSGNANTLTGANVNNTWSVTGNNAGTVTGIGNGFSNIQNVVGGNGSNTFVINGGNLSGSITGGSGTNTLVANSSTFNNWALTGVNAGSVTNVGNGFSNIQNVTGGNAGNTFLFNNGASLSGLLNGGSLAATNTMSFLPYLTTVTANLAGNIFSGNVMSGATPLVSSYANINNLIGNGGYFNILNLPNKMNRATITGPAAGTIDDPLTFNGFYILNAANNNNTVTFTVPVTITNGSNVVIINGVPMTFNNFILGSSGNNALATQSSSANTGSSEDSINVSAIVQQPITNANNDAGYIALPGSSNLDQNISDMVNQITGVYDKQLENLQIVPNCYANDDSF